MNSPPAWLRLCAQHCSRHSIARAVLALWSVRAKWFLWREGSNFRRCLPALPKARIGIFICPACSCLSGALLFPAHNQANFLFLLICPACSCSSEAPLVPPQNKANFLSSRFFAAAKLQAEANRGLRDDAEPYCGLRDGAARPGIDPIVWESRGVDPIVWTWMIHT